MANSPVDRATPLMEKDFGTRVLITDSASEHYLNLAAKQRKEKEEQMQKHPEGEG